MVQFIKNIKNAEIKGHIATRAKHETDGKNCRNSITFDFKHKNYNNNREKNRKYSLFDQYFLVISPLGSSVSDFYLFSLGISQNMIFPHGNRIFDDFFVSVSYVCFPLERLFASIIEISNARENLMRKRAKLHTDFIKSQHRLRIFAKRAVGANGHKKTRRLMDQKMPFGIWLANITPKKRCIHSVVMRTLYCLYLFPLARKRLTTITALI